MKIRETEFSESAERPLRSVAQKCVATDIYRYDRGDILPSLCKGRWRTKCAGRVVIYRNRRLLQNIADILHIRR